MRLLITVTVLYLVNSSVYSFWPPIEEPICARTADCAQGMWCDYSRYIEWGFCSTERKGKGEECLETAACAQGLECKFTHYGKWGTCSTKRKSQYFWLVTFEPKLDHIGLRLDKFVTF